MARCLLDHSGLPNTYWEFAMDTAVYISNRLPSRVNDNLSPIEALTGQAPNVSHIRVFGCLAYVHVPDELRRKLDKKAIRCIFLGFDKTQKAFVLETISSGKRVISRDVNFDETQFPRNMSMPSHVAAVNDDPHPNNVELEHSISVNPHYAEDGSCPSSSYDYEQQATNEVQSSDDAEQQLQPQSVQLSGTTDNSQSNNLSGSTNQLIPTLIRPAVDNNRNTEKNSQSNSLSGSKIDPTSPRTLIRSVINNNSISERLSEVSPNISIAPRTSTRFKAPIALFQHEQEDAGIRRHVAHASRQPAILLIRLILSIGVVVRNSSLNRVLPEGSGTTPAASRRAAQAGGHLVVQGHSAILAATCPTPLGAAREGGGWLLALGDCPEPGFNYLVNHRQWSRNWPSCGPT